ncbi:MAG: DEAD/DEAH box helicase [Verrucomicrobia bacterium]|nr:DEAD/DEAH box helicase [Verrucomicrobiota bacterium]
MSFKALGLDPNILTAIEEAGYTEPTPIQAAAIPVVIQGGDVIGIAQTGTGKTAAFTLPILTRLTSNPVPQGQRRRTRVLVLAPTRELVAQIEENVLAYARHLPLKIAKIYGGVGEKPQKDALRAGSDIVIACPGRLLDLMEQRCADFSQLEYLVLDEADRMLDMGFLPDIRRVISQLPKKRQTLMFSATLSKEIETLTHEFQRGPKIVQIGKRANPAETVTQLVYEVHKHLKMPLLSHLLKDEKMQMVLVFSRTKHGADKIAKKLESTGVKCATLHANRSQNQRLRALDDFKTGTVRVLVATDIAARGIDVDGISHVVNFDFPHIVEDYVHRIGRTGRAQAIGDAISFVSPDELPDVRKLERFINRGLVRKKAEGFDYNAAPQPFSDERPERREQQRQFQQRRPQGQGGGRPSGGGGGGGGSRSGGYGGQGGGRSGGQGGQGGGGGRQGGERRSSSGSAPRQPAQMPQQDTSPAGARGLWKRLTGR